MVGAWGTDRDWRHAGGAFSVDYEWYYIDDSKALIPIGFNSPSYTVVDAQESDAGDYQVVVSSGPEIVPSNVVQLSIAPAMPVAGGVAMALFNAALALGGAMTLLRRR